MSEYKTGQNVWVVGMVKQPDGWKRDKGNATLQDYDYENGIWTTNREGEMVYENKEHYDKWVESADKTDSRYYIDEEETKKKFSRIGKASEVFKHIGNVTKNTIRDVINIAPMRLNKIRNLDAARKNLPFNVENQEEYNNKTDEMNVILRSLPRNSKIKILNEIQPNHDLTEFHYGGKRKSRRIKKSKRKRTRKSKTKKRRSNRRK